MTTNITEQEGPRLLPYYLAQAVLLGSLASVIALLGDIRDNFNLSETEIGLIVGAGFLAAFLTQLIVSPLADRGFGPQMVRLGMAASALSMVGFALASTFTTFMLARAILGVAVGVAQPAVRRTVVLAEPEQTGRNIGRLGVSEVTGFALTPAIAAGLAEFTTIDIPFFVIGAAILVVMLGMGTLTADEGAQSSDDRSTLALLKDPKLVGTLLLVTSEFILIGGYEAVWAVMLTDLGAETWQIGVGFMIFAIPLGALAPFGGAWAQRSGGALPAIVGIGASALLAIPFGFVGTVWGLIAVAFVSAIGSGIGFPAALFVYSRTVDDERQAAAQGLMGATEVLFGGIAAVFAAWLYDNQGQRAVWIWIPTLMLAVLLGGALLRLLAEQHNGDRPGSR